MAQKSNIRKIRDYQKDGTKAIVNLPAGTSGQVILPTGSGKTIIGEEAIKTIAKSKETTVSAVFVPRLLLGKQWIRRSAVSLLQQSKLPFAFININSGGVRPEIKRLIEAAQMQIKGAGTPPLRTTTNADEVRKEVFRLREKGFHVIALSTYHSSGVLLDSGVRCDLGLFDECQYLVSANKQETEYRQSMSIPIDRRVFMTATPRTTDSIDGQGMNNINEFGPVIFEKKPREIIEAGAIVGPKMHLVGAESIIEGIDYNSRTEMIYQSWNRHKEEIKKNSADPDRIGGKMLVVCDGQMMLTGILNSKRFKEIRKEQPDLKIFALCSEYGVYINGNHISPPVSSGVKEDLLKALDELDPSEDAIILHVDMIAEGLDVPCLTGVLPFRNCNKIKLLQNLGRTSRLHPDDENRIFNTGELTPGDYSNYVKPNCYVILPYAIENRDDFLDRNATIIDAMRTEYGFDPSDSVICDILHPAQEGPDWNEDKLQREIRSSATTAIKDFYHLMEDEAMTVDRLVQVNKMRRFTPEQIEAFIGMAAGAC